MFSSFNEIFKYLFQFFLVINNVILKGYNTFIEIKRENNNILVKLSPNKC